MPESGPAEVPVTSTDALLRDGSNPASSPVLEFAGRLEKNPALVRAGVYTREMAAPLAAVWENVYDWEHLPWLHDQAFAEIELLDSGDWGWHVELALSNGARSTLELRTLLDQGCYVARTLSGFGAGSEIWTTLTAGGSNRTDVRVEFWVTEMPAETLRDLGASYRELYAGLWDQDEEMIQTRLRAFAERDRLRAAGGAIHSNSNSNSNSDSEPDTAAEASAQVAAATVRGEATTLGLWSEVQEKLPLVVEFGGRKFRIVLVDEQPVAHSTECPHWLGPLEACEVEAGILRCPWHGYAFDVRTGESADGRALRLRPAPRVEIDPETQQVWLQPTGGGEKSSSV